MAGTNRPPNYTLIYFKLSYVCPKTWRFSKDELETVTPQTLTTYLCISWDPRISVCFSTYYIFLVGCSKWGWLATQSTPPDSLRDPVHSSCKLAYVAGRRAKVCRNWRLNPRKKKRILREKGHMENNVNIPTSFYAWSWSIDGITDVSLHVNKQLQTVTGCECDEMTGKINLWII